MISLAMIVINECREGPSKVALAERDHAIEALVFDRSYEPFGVRVRIARLKRRLHNVHSGIAQQTPNRPTPFSIPISDQHVMIAQ